MKGAGQKAPKHQKTPKQQKRAESRSQTRCSGNDENPETANAEPIHPNYVYRKSAYGRRFFGFGPTTIDKKIAEGEIPAPFPLSKSGRAQAWYGWQIIQHQQEQRAAKIAAENAANSGGA